MFWAHGRPWEGKTCCIVAGGPSTTPEHARLASDAFPTMALKDMFVLCPQAKIIYSCDLSWWFERWRDPDFAPTLKAHPAIRVAMYYQKLKTGVEDLKYLQCTGPDELDINEGCVRHGLNTGFSGLNLAFNLGPKRIILVGYDMRAIGGKSHCYSNHVPIEPGIYRQYVGTMRTIAPLIKKRGVEVVNTSMESALDCFPKMGFDAAMEWGKQ
jgi:hypothetical protein